MRFLSSYQPRLQSSENLADPGRSTSKAHLHGYWLKASVPRHMVHKPLQRSSHDMAVGVTQSEESNGEREREREPT